jgi:hypothetical protein
VRKFTGGDGSDTTSAVIAYLAANRQLILADLYLIGELEDPSAVWLTNWDSPLSWPAWGTFKPAAVKRGQVTSQIGLKVDSLDVTWSPKLTAFGTSVATANPYQLAQTGFYDNKTVRLWRCVMPTPGDANTFGATPWFGGRVADTEISRGSIKFTVNSFLDVVNQKIPPNVIEASNLLAEYSGNVPVLADVETTIPTFTVVAPSNANVILGQCLGPHSGKIYDTNKFANPTGFMVFLKGSSLAGYWSPIASNSNYDAGGGTHYNQFQVFGSFPFAPSPGDDFYVSTQLPNDFATASSLGVFQGFPFVPDPLTAV